MTKFGNCSEFPILHFVGTAGFLIQDVGQVIVMWSVPYDSNLYSNWMAVGIYPRPSRDIRGGKVYLEIRRFNNGMQQFNSIDLFTEMYYYRTTWFRRKQFYSNVTPVSFCSDRICVSGSIGTSSVTTAKFTVIPRNYAHLAPSLKSSVAAQSWNQAIG